MGGCKQGRIDARVGTVHDIQLVFLPLRSSQPRHRAPVLLRENVRIPRAVLRQRCCEEERIFIELMTSDRKLKARNEGYTGPANARRKRVMPRPPEEAPHVTRTYATEKIWRKTMASTAP